MNDQAPLIVSISGIRGIVGASLTDDCVRRFAAAFATALEPDSRVVLARDTRPSGAAFVELIARTLSQCGCRVVDLGVCSTPGAKLMVLELEAQGAIIVTASHNPLPWNGLKMIRADGVFLNAEQGQRIIDLYDGGDFRHSPGAVVESFDPAETKRRHLERILGAVDVDAIRAAGLKAAVDPCNGTGGVLLPDLLEALGVEAHFIHAEPNGQFAHEPEPLPANLVDLGCAVRDNGCQVGFAIDPDADRVALVGEDGAPLGEDYTLALAVQAQTARRPGTVVTTLSTSQIVSDAALANGCRVILTPVGEVNVVEKMIEEGAVIGGEGNGGVILTQVDPGRDAALGVALVLEALAQAGTGLVGLAATLPAYHIEKRKVDCTAAQLERAIDAMLERYPKAWRHPVEDGAKIYLKGREACPWIHLRPSNTEPIVRIIAESATAVEARALCDEAEGLLG
jgi:phosphomannomutase